MIDQFSLSTGSGSWNPVVWLIALAVALIVVLVIWARGERSYRREGGAAAPFLSGNAEPEKEQAQIRAGNLYWGFTEALSGYYKRIVPIHTGILNDYVLWFLGTMATIILVLAVVR